MAPLVLVNFTEMAPLVLVIFFYFFVASDTLLRLKFQTGNPPDSRNFETYTNSYFFEIDSKTGSYILIKLKFKTIIQTDFFQFQIHHS